MPDPTYDNSGVPGPATGDIKRAIEDAVRAVESASSQGGDSPGHEGAPEPRGNTPSRSIETAVAESLLSAKKELEEALQQTQTEAKSLRDKWLRAAADLENYKKRAIKEREDGVRFANERLLRDFLPIVDDLDRVVSSPIGDDPHTKAVAEGVSLVLKKFVGQLEKHGVTAFGAQGQPFDPNRQEAVAQVHSEQPVGMVVGQLQRGFLLNERLLRPALVTVSLGPIPSATSEDGKG